MSLLLAACYGGAAGPTPRGMGDVLREVFAHRAAMTDTGAGGAGCADQTLVDNARKLRVSFAPDKKTYTVYLFRWLNNRDYGEASRAFDACVAAYQGANTGSAVEKVDVSPWRAFGPDWSPELQDAVAGALTAAATGE